MNRRNLIKSAFGIGAIGATSSKLLANEDKLDRWKYASSSDDAVGLDHKLNGDNHINVGDFIVLPFNSTILLKISDTTGPNHRFWAIDTFMLQKQATFIALKRGTWEIKQKVEKDLYKKFFEKYLSLYAPNGTANGIMFIDIENSTTDKSIVSKLVPSCHYIAGIASYTALVVPFYEELAENYKETHQYIFEPCKFAKRFMDSKGFHLFPS